MSRPTRTLLLAAIGLAGVLLSVAGAVSPPPVRTGSRPVGQVGPGSGATARPAASPVLPAAKSPETVAPPDAWLVPELRQWDSFTVADGLPSNKVFVVRVDGQRVWAGTDKGLAKYENGRWTTFGTAQGLPHQVVLTIDVSPLTGDVWIGTMGGLARFSGGRIDSFTQLTSGLSNDFINDVECDRELPQVWVATAMGVCRLDLVTNTWSVFTEENTPMHEPWTYSVAAGHDAVWIGAWGAGVLEYRKNTGVWRPYRDPDKEMEMDLLPDDGPVHDVTSGVDFQDGVLWQASYFGLARYDGRMWQSYFREDSGLASNFIFFVRARGRVAWLATDNGLSATDGKHWITYRRTPAGRGELLRYDRKPDAVSTVSLATGPAHNYTLSVDFQGDDVWVATEAGVSRGRAAGPPALTRGVPSSHASQQ